LGNQGTHADGNDNEAEHKSDSRWLYESFGCDRRRFSIFESLAGIGWEGDPGPPRKLERASAKAAA
jgi:hypothetical protein